MTHPDPRQHGPWQAQGRYPQHGHVPHGPQQGGGAPQPGQYGAPPPGGTPPGATPPAGPQGPYGPPGAHPYQPPRKSGAGTGLIIGAVLLVLVLMVGGGAVAFSLLSQGGEGSASAEGIGTVRHFTDLSADHVDEGETVEYEVYPPAGGPHYPVWQDCGVYEEPLIPEYVVHSQEHGAVWIAHDPGLSEAGVQILHSYYSPGDYLVISPAEDLPAPVVASAWGSQMHLEDPADPRLVEYLVEYVQGDGTPEPGAACSGGRSGTGATGTGGSGIDASEFTGTATAGA